MRRNIPTQESLQEDNKLHPVAKLIIADPKVIAQTLLYEVQHGEVDTFNALAQLLEINRNEGGKNLASYVTTANLKINKVENYLFDEGEFVKAVCSHLSQRQIDSLLVHNKGRLKNPEPTKELQLVREIFGEPEILKPGEGNSYLKAFLTEGKKVAANSPLETPQQKPTIQAVKASTTDVSMLSMCLTKGYSPLRRHDGSHTNSGFGTTEIGEICNQTHDLGQNSLAQYGVVPTLQEQLLNRKIIFSFEGLPEKLKGLKRSWRSYVSNALETWRSFLVEHPEYVEKWQLKGLVDAQMRMVKRDGSPIISAQTGKQQIPVIDYTDLVVIHALQKKLDRILTDEEVYSSLPYDKLYEHALLSIKLLGEEYIVRDGAPPVVCDGMFDCGATFKNAPWGHFDGLPELSDLSSPDLHNKFCQEIEATEKKRTAGKQQGRWHGYLIDIGQDSSKPVWVSETPPPLAIIYPKALTVKRVSLPLEYLENQQINRIFTSSASYLVDPVNITIESTLSQRDDNQIPLLPPVPARPVTHEYANAR